MEKRFPIPPVRTVGDLEDRLRQHHLSVGGPPISGNLDLGGVHLAWLNGPVKDRGVYSLNIGFSLAPECRSLKGYLLQSPVTIVNEKTGSETTAHFTSYDDDHLSLNVIVPEAGDYVFSIQPK